MDQFKINKRCIYYWNWFSHQTKMMITLFYIAPFLNFNILKNRFRFADFSQLTLLITPRLNFDFSRRNIAEIYQSNLSKRQLHGLNELAFIMHLWTKKGSYIFVSRVMEEEFLKQNVSSWTQYSSFKWSLNLDWNSWF